ncbi:MAG: tRNA (adenosine(37)-N6)-threonylcarbamoyltransferase complex ATPase subunit type 1 TsaE [bacterium]
MDIKRLDDIIGKSIETLSPNETIGFGRMLSGLLCEGSVIALVGELGAGKTVLIKGIAEGLGITDIITSPTFIIANFYIGRLPFAHIDLYRVDDENAIKSGIYEYFLEDGITALEWADRAPSIIPDNAIKITIDILDEKRRLIKVLLWSNDEK